MHALKKRVRSVQKEKLTLRAEIMRIRAEKEQVALKMDAVRMRHETANRETLVRSPSEAIHSSHIVLLTSTSTN